MPPLDATTLSRLAHEFTDTLLRQARELPADLRTAESRAALERGLLAGLLALPALAGARTLETQVPLSAALERLAPDAAAGRALAPLLRGEPLDAAALAVALRRAGYALPPVTEVDLESGWQGLGATCAAAWAREPALAVLPPPSAAPTAAGQQAFVEELLAQLRRINFQGAGLSADTITATNVVSGVQVLVQFPATRADDWERPYLRALIAQVDPLDLAPLAAEGSDDAPPTVSQVYTGLHLAGVVGAASQPLAEALRSAPALDPAGLPTAAGQPPVAALEALAACPCLVVLGEGGSGKSTLLRYLAAQLARRRLGTAVPETQLPGWGTQRPLPVWIETRRLATWRLPAGDLAGVGLIWGYLRHRLKEDGCEHYYERLHQLLNDEGGLLLVDGLDEVSDEGGNRRDVLRQALLAWARQYGRVVLTARPYAYRAGSPWRLPAAEFLVVALAPFDTAQQTAFAHAWYTCRPRPLGSAVNWATQQAAALLQTLQEQPRLAEMGQRPLLLALMAQLHAHGRLQGEHRAELYERVVDLLLVHWEDARGGAAPVALPREALRRVLYHLAYEAHARQETQKNRQICQADIPRGELRDLLEAELEGDAASAKQAVAYIEQRTGLLLARGDRTYAFPHRTFQEYLAAQHLLEQGEAGERLCDLLQRDPDWWREVFLLAVGSARGQADTVYALISCLLQATPPAQPTAQQAALAAQALEESGWAEKARNGRPVPGRFAGLLDRADQVLHPPDPSAEVKRLREQLAEVEARLGAAQAVSQQARARAVACAETERQARADLAQAQQALATWPARLQQAEAKAAAQSEAAQADIERLQGQLEATQTAQRQAEAEATTQREAALRACQEVQRLQEQLDTAVLAGQQAEAEAATQVEAARKARQDAGRLHGQLDAALMSLQEERDENARLRKQLAELRVHPPANPLILNLAPGVTLELARVPAGEFLMGSDKSKDPQARDSELPQHSVRLDEFLIGKCEVTVAQFRAFVQATNYRTQAERDGQSYIWTGSKWEEVAGADWQHPRGPMSDVHGKDNHPVVHVSWDDAVAFCAWASQATGCRVCLPNEMQWEKAARGMDGRIYPWGNQVPDDKRCNFGRNVGTTTPVGEYSPQGDSPYGCVDMAGNVWEWTSSLYKPYPYKAEDGREDAAIRGARVLRGSSFYHDASFVRVAYRYHTPDIRLSFYGFRVCVSPI